MAKKKTTKGTVKKTKDVKSTDITYSKPTNEQKQYQQWFLPGGDPDFNPDKNKAVIEKTIRDYEQLRRKKVRDYVESVAERAEATIAYASYLDTGGAKPAEAYFGKKLLAYLRGQKIMAIIKNGRKQLFEIEGNDYLD